MDTRRLYCIDPLYTSSIQAEEIVHVLTSRGFILMRTPRVIIGLIRTSEVGLTMQRIRNASVARGTFEVVPKYRRLRTVSECILFIDCARTINLSVSDLTLIDTVELQM